MTTIIKLEDVQVGDSIQLKQVYNKYTSSLSGTVTKTGSIGVWLDGYGLHITYPETVIELLDRPTPKPKVGDKVLVSCDRADPGNYYPHAEEVIYLIPDSEHFITLDKDGEPSNSRAFVSWKFDK